MSFFQANMAMEAWVDSLECVDHFQAENTKSCEHIFPHVRMHMLPAQSQRLDSCRTQYAGIFQLDVVTQNIDCDDCSVESIGSGQILKIIDCLMCELKDKSHIIITDSDPLTEDYSLFFYQMRRGNGGPLLPYPRPARTSDKYRMAALDVPFSFIKCRC